MLGAIAINWLRSVLTATYPTLWPIILGSLFAGVVLLVLAFLVGMVQGGTQALTRSLYASLIPPYKAGELFGFYGSMDKFAGMMGPTFMGLVAAATGSTRIGILSILIFFVVGAVILSLVDVEGGRRIAREAQARARPLEAAAVPTP